jgi:hypothetical protein
MAEDELGFERFVSAQLGQSLKQQTLSNKLQMRRDAVASKEKALEMAVKLRMDDTTIKKLQRQIYDMCMQDFTGDDGGVGQTNITPSTIQAAARMPSSVAAAPFTPSKPLASLSPPNQRQCLRPTPDKCVEQHVDDLSQLFREMDVPGDGNCGFHVMKIIHERHFPTLNSANYNHAVIRKRIVQIMQDEADSIFIARRDCDISGPFNIYVKDEMVTEHGSVDAYCERMGKIGVDCGLNEFATFVHWIGDDIRIFFHSTKLVRGTPEVIELARESVRSSAREYHVLHKDGEDGKNGHFVFLNSIVKEAD